MRHDIHLNKLKGLRGLQMGIADFRCFRRFAGSSHLGGAQFSLDAANTGQRRYSLLAKASSDRIGPNLGKLPRFFGLRVQLAAGFPDGPPNSFWQLLRATLWDMSPVL